MGNEITGGEKLVMMVDFRYGGYDIILIELSSPVDTTKFVQICVPGLNYM